MICRLPAMICIGVVGEGWISGSGRRAVFPMFFSSATVKPVLESMTRAYLPQFIGHAPYRRNISRIGLGTDCMCDAPHHDEVACMSRLCGRCHRNHCRDGRHRKLFGRQMQITTLEYLMRRMRHEMTIGQPCAGRPHIRLEEISLETESKGHRA